VFFRFSKKLCFVDYPQNKVRMRSFHDVHLVSGGEDVLLDGGGKCGFEKRRPHLEVVAPLSDENTGIGTLDAGGLLS
jgi:hypothetical protein